MRVKKISVLKNTFTGYNDSGEELFNYIDNGDLIYGRVSFSSTSETYTANRESSETVLKIYCDRLYDNIDNNDRLIYRGRTYTIDGVPELWENDRGYRNVTVITARYVEG